MRKDIKEIRQVLKDYSKIKQDLSQVNFLPSPHLDVVSSHSNSNQAELKFIYHANLSYQMYRVEKAIKDIKDSKHRFIINKYIVNKKYSRKEICDRYNIGLRTFNHMKNQALIEFAKNYGLDSLLDEMKKPQVYEWSSYVVSTQMKLGEKSVCGRNQNNKTVVQRLPSLESESSP